MQFDRDIKLLICMSSDIQTRYTKFSSSANFLIILDICQENSNKIKEDVENEPKEKKSKTSTKYFGKIIRKNLVLLSSLTN